MFKLLASFFFFGILFSVQTTMGQAKNALGIGPAINTSKQGSYNTEGGFGGVLQGEIKLAPKFALIPAIGVEIPYTGYGGLSVKYYPVDKVHLKLGAIAYIGGDIDAGLAPSVDVGCQLLSSGRHFIDLDLHGEVIKIDQYENTTVIGLRLTYNFSFSKQK